MSNLITEKARECLDDRKGALEMKKEEMEERILKLENKVDDFGSSLIYLLKWLEKEATRRAIERIKKED